MIHGSESAVSSSGMWALAIHGGAGSPLPEERERSHVRAACQALRTALDAGTQILGSGGSALDAVEASVRALEDCPLFNAGRGAVFNADGEHELDASIMDGKDMRAGAVGAVRGVKNPITLARAIMERSRQVLLHGDGAIALARRSGLEIEMAGREYFTTEARWRELEETRRRGGQAPTRFATVGAVALDRNGNLAAATSTGGITGKPAGRVGDSAIIGAGTYASNASCAVSGTGHGETFMRGTAARDVAALMEYGGFDLAAAVERVLFERLASLGGTGGLIAVDRGGNIVLRFSAEAMYRGAASATEPPWTAWP